MVHWSLERLVFWGPNFPLPPKKEERVLLAAAASALCTPRRRRHLSLSVLCQLLSALLSSNA